MVEHQWQAIREHHDSDVATTLALEGINQKTNVEHQPNLDSSSIQGATDEGEIKSSIWPGSLSALVIHWPPASPGTSVSLP